MFLGHFAAGLLASRSEPRLPLGTAFLAAQLPDASFLLFALVASHWVLDFVSHRPDMPVLPNGPFLGLGLWYSVAATVLVEGLLFLGAVILYAKSRAPGKGFWGLMAFLLVIYSANLLGPPPPSVIAIAVSLIALVPILWWWGNRASPAS